MLNYAAGSSVVGYNLTRSLRFRASASATLTRTFSTPTSQNVFTFSAWVKRGALSSNFSLFGDSAGNNVLRFISSDVLRVEGSVSLATTAVFRDPSAWYHVVYRQNGTTATVWVNNNSVLTGTVTVSSLNTAAGMTLGGPTSLGSFDGYLAEVNFIDGQALTPSSFGSTNALTGVWQPAAYVGTYGTNGFYLPFTDNSTAAALGTDFSGNSNTWTTNNISVTAGVTYDSMTDVPTLTSATTANYAVLNPLVSLTFGATLTNGNLNFVGVAAGQHVIAQSTAAMPSGKWYAEFTLTAFGGANPQVGIIDVSTNVYTANPFIGSFALGYAYVANAQKYNNNTATAYGATYTTNDVIGVAFDTSTGTLEFFKNGTSQGNAYTGITGNYAFVVDAYNSGSWAANFGQRPFSYAPPTGFVALNTFNLPAATIVKGNTVMDATTYTGNGSTQTITNAAGFQPDLVWVKSRSAATDHAWYDSVRGTTKQIESNNTGVETTQATGLTAFGSTGFSVGALTQVNTNAATYVGWQWKAGQGTTSSNTDGTITSTVSVNPSAGFSIVTYNGTGANATVGHGLGVAPKMIIVKARESTNPWIVGNANLISWSYRLLLNDSGAQVLNTTHFNATAPTSSVFSVGSSVATNESAKGMVAYCFADIDGFSKFGRYTGNGSANGPFVYLGFRPRWIMFKNAGAGSTLWTLYDTARQTFNLMNLFLSPEANATESTAIAATVDLLSNGFKLRGTSLNTNDSGVAYIYAAFAENPTKYSLAR
jgi:hypothetical protein